MRYRYKSRSIRKVDDCKRRSTRKSDDYEREKADSTKKRSLPFRYYQDNSLINLITMSTPLLCLLNSIAFL